MKNCIDFIPLGYSTIKFQGENYGVSKNFFNNGKSVKVYAEELGGTDFISFNYYITKTQNYLKPCEMELEKVIEFIEQYKSQSTKADLQ